MHNRFWTWSRGLLNLYHLETPDKEVAWTVGEAFLPQRLIKTTPHRPAYREIWWKNQLRFSLSRLRLGLWHVGKTQPAHWGSTSMATCAQTNVAGLSGDEYGKGPSPEGGHHYLLSMAEAVKTMWRKTHAWQSWWRLEAVWMKCSGCIIN